MTRDQGRRDFEGLRRSVHFAFIVWRTIDVRTAEAYFLPALEHADIDRNLARPVPAGRREWREGFEAARNEAMLEEGGGGGGSG